jgi:hypothetical protein
VIAEYRGRLRWGGAAGLLPIPGPLDEFVLLVVAAVLWLFYRDRFTEAWQQAGTPPTGAASTSSS